MYDTFIISSRKDLPYPLTHSVCPLLYQKHLLNRGNPKLFPVLIFKEKGRSWLFYYHFFSLPLLFFWDLPPDSHMTWEYNMLLTPSASCHAPYILLTQQAVLTYCVSNISNLLTLFTLFCKSCSWSSCTHGMLCFLSAGLLRRQPVTYQQPSVLSLSWCTWWGANFQMCSGLWIWARAGGQTPVLHRNARAVSLLAWQQR